MIIRKVRISTEAQTGESHRSQAFTVFTTHLLFFLRLPQMIHLLASVLVDGQAFYPPHLVPQFLKQVVASEFDVLERLF